MVLRATNGTAPPFDVWLRGKSLPEPTAEEELEEPGGGGRREMFQGHAAMRARGLVVGESPRDRVASRPSHPCRRSSSTPAGTSPRPANPVTRRDSSQNGKGDVSLCVRLRPGENPVASVEGDVVRLRPAWTRDLDATFHCDHAFSGDADQERVFTTAVTPICESVVRGYNGAVIAYGQTGSGKTHTMVGERQGLCRGIAPRAVSWVFDALEDRPNCGVMVSVLEIYNEKARDLLSPTSGVCVGVHEHAGSGTFSCPDAVQRPVKAPQEALDALFQGLQRRETAWTDMNHSSSRSHLVFTLTISQKDEDMGATLCSRFHLVDLAGSERLKRSLGSARGKSPAQHKELQKEACEINKSLSQLALVIQRLTGSVSYIPYRDSLLTRLLAESFGGNSKTCLIITCASTAENREETRCSLEFGKRAKLVKNRAEINLEVSAETSPFLKAFIAKEAQLQQEVDRVQSERDVLLAADEVWKTQRAAMEREREDFLRRLSAAEATAAMAQEELALQTVESAKLRETMSSTEAAQKTLQQNFRTLESELHRTKEEYTRENSRRKALAEEHAHSISKLLEEKATLQRLREESAADVLRLRQEHEDALSKRDADHEALCLRWKEDVTNAKKESALVIARLEEESVVFRQRLEATMCDMLRFSDEKAALDRSFQEERASLVARSHEESRKFRDEKAVLVAELEETKMEVHRKWQEEAAKLREAKAVAVADAEQEMSVLRKRLQDALGELRRLQSDMANMETQFHEQQAASAAALQAECAAQRLSREQWELALADRTAAATARFEREREELHRSCDEELARRERDAAARVSNAEAEKSVMQRHLQDAISEARKLAEDRAALVSQLAAASWEPWQDVERRTREHFAETAVEPHGELTLHAVSAGCTVPGSDRDDDVVLAMRNELLRRLHRDDSGIGHLQRSRHSGSVHKLMSSASGATTAAPDDLLGSRRFLHDSSDMLEAHSSASSAFDADEVTTPHF